jgi:hypothetical protein
MVRSKPTGTLFDEVLSYLKMLRTAARTEKMGRAACWCAQGAPRVAVRCSDLDEEWRTKTLTGPNAFGVDI